MRYQFVTYTLSADAQRPTQRAPAALGAYAAPTTVLCVDNDVELLGVASDADAACLLYTSPSPRDGLLSRMPSSA